MIKLKKLLFLLIYFLIVGSVLISGCTEQKNAVTEITSSQSTDVNVPSNQQNTQTQPSQNTETTTIPTQTPTPAVETQSDKATMGEKNALSKAKDYLDYSAFSYSGLVKQLEYEGFTHQEAVYGVDNCGADWNEQAAIKAPRTHALQ